MTIKFFTQLFRYDAWANQRIAASVEQINNPSEKMLHLLGHIIGAQEIWLDRMQDINPDFLKLDRQQSPSELKKRMKNTETILSQFVANLEYRDLEKVISYKSIKGDAFESAVSDILMQLINHGTHHRAQISQLIRQQGVQPPAIDYIVFTRGK